MGGLGGEELGSQVADGPLVGLAALARLPELELRVRGKKSLVVGWAAKGFLATCL